MKFFTSISTLKKDLTTYNVGLLQHRTYRMLKSHTDAFLKPYKMTSTEWAYLGILYERPLGLRPNELAVILGVEAPFITSLSTKYHARKIIEYRKDITDSRAKCIYLTPDGIALVREIEPLLRKESRKWLKGLPINQILTYIKVLKKLSMYNTDSE